MHLLNLTLAAPAENLALDEALLDACTAGDLPGGVLRLWEAPSPMVVVGRGTRLVDEVLLDTCRRDQLPVGRRVSGGMSIVAGPGCLMYAVVEPHPVGGKASIDLLHRQVLTTITLGLQQAGLDVRAAGTSDLVIPASDGSLRKVSGNSLRMARTAYLYHGTVLYDFELPLIPRYLRQPPRAPEYRGGRPHGDFVANLPATRDSLEHAIATAFAARENLASWPRARVRHLVQSRYAADAWTYSR